MEESTTDIDALEYAPQRRHGVRLGFLTVLALAAAAAALYVNAVALAARLTALEGALSGYAAAIDAARVQLDSLARSLAGADDA